MFPRCREGFLEGGERDSEKLDREGAEFVEEEEGEWEVGSCGD